MASSGSKEPSTAAGCRAEKDIEVLFQEALKRQVGHSTEDPTATTWKLSRAVAWLRRLGLTLLGSCVRGGAWRVQDRRDGFDVPGPGAVNQPWHRDFASARDADRSAFELSGVQRHHR